MKILLTILLAPICLLASERSILTDADCAFHDRQYSKAACLYNEYLCEIADLSAVEITYAEMGLWTCYKRLKEAYLAKMIEARIKSEEDAEAIIDMIIESPFLVDIRPIGEKLIMLVD